MSTRLPDCHGGVLYSLQITASVGLTVSTGSLPPGFTYIGAYGVLIGTTPAFTSTSGVDQDYTFTLSDSSSWVVCNRGNAVLNTWASATAGSTYSALFDIWAVSQNSSHLVDSQAAPFALTHKVLSGIDGSLFSQGQQIAIYTQLGGSATGYPNNGTSGQLNTGHLNDVYVDSFAYDNPAQVFSGIPYIGGGTYTRSALTNSGTGGALCADSTCPGDCAGSILGCPCVMGEYTLGNSGTTVGFDFGFTPPTPGGSWPGVFQTVLKGTVILDSNGMIQIAVTAGTTGRGIPTWITTGGLTSDGTVQWQGHGSSAFSGPTGDAITVECDCFNSLAEYTTETLTVSGSISPSPNPSNWIIQEIETELEPSGVPLGPLAGFNRYTIRCIDETQIGSFLQFWEGLGGGGGSITSTPSFSQSDGLPTQPAPPTPQVIGDVIELTANYSTAAADSGSLLSFNATVPVTLTLPNPAPAEPWFVFVENVSANNVTVSPNSLLLDTSSSSVILKQNQGFTIYSDGTNYRSGDRGLGFTLPLTTKGDILGFDTVPDRIPVGVDGQVLTADSSTALGVEWADPTEVLPLTTKGDILGYDTTPDRIPVGSDGEVLTADSTQALGVKWSTAGSGTVSSVGLTMPAEFNVSGSPVTGSSGFTVTNADENEGTFAAGPVSGSPAPWGFRGIEPSDLPVATSSSFGAVKPDNITVTVSAGVLSAAPSPGVGAVGVIGANLLPNIPAYIDIPWNFTITGWSIIGYGASSGSASVDVWFESGSAPPSSPSIPTSANKISASAPVAVSSAATAAGGSSAISTWTTSLTQWGTVGFNPNTFTSFTTVQVLLFGIKS